MESYKNWVVCLDLTSMDEVVAGYVNYFAQIIKPESIKFLHIIESYDALADAIEEFPELETEEDVNELLSNKIESTVNKHLTYKCETGVLLRKGGATSQIIKLMEEDTPDLLVLGKKITFAGEGVLTQRIVKYVPCSILFVPESARYSMSHIVVPVDFSEQSAQAIKLAQGLAKSEGGSVTAQHIFKYPMQFFPYMPDKNAMKELGKELKQAEAEFRKKYEIGDDLELVLTENKEGRMSDDIYDLTVHRKSDMIVVASKARKNMLKFLNDNLADRMTNYPFGVPLFVWKHKERNQKTLKSLFS